MSGGECLSREGLIHSEWGIADVQTNAYPFDPGEIPVN